MPLIWPDPQPLDAHELSRLTEALRPACNALLHTDLAHAPERILDDLILPLAAWAAARTKGHTRPWVLGINGAQGTGKTTLATLLAKVLAEGFGLSTVALSLDDFYLTRATREELARTQHPLLRTRGVPGTHDVPLALATLDRLAHPENGATVALPTFDKARDDRRPEQEWPQITTPVDVVLFEGWCVGAVPEPAARLARPVNALEREEDADGLWRRHVNVALQDPYATLFARLDALIFLKAPNMEKIAEWRGLQERRLAERTRTGQRECLMDAQALARFLQHYERLTRWMLEEMPARADLTLHVDTTHQVSVVTPKPA